MAFQTAQKMRRMASPSNSKSCPMKAIQTFGLTKGFDASPNAQLLGIDAQNQASITLRRFSPDSAFHSGSPVPKERKGLLHGLAIRRTGSCDMISSSSYLNGEWLRLGSFVSQTCLTCDKSTQTSDECQNLRSSYQFSKKWKAAAASTGSLKDVRPRTKFGKEMPTVFQHNASSLNVIAPSVVPAKLALRGRSACHCGGSLEGLNQEIEKLVMQGNVLVDHIKSPMDGRREPVADQLNTCSRVTQTTDGGLVLVNLETEGLPQEDSVAGELDDCDIKIFKESSECVNFHSPKAVNSRLPPEGCEKVEGKFKEIQEDGSRQMEIPFFKPPVIQYHIPSELSAFNPLVKNYLNQPAELARQFTSLAVLHLSD